MVMSPEKQIFAIRAFQQREAHERRSDQIESAVSIVSQIEVQFLSLVFEMNIGPIVYLYRKAVLIGNALKRFIHPVPKEACPQNGVAFDYAAPRSFKGGNIEIPRQPADDLSNVDSGFA